MLPSLMDLAAVTSLSAQHLVMSVFSLSLCQQAILPLRGKILNVERKDDAALYKNQEIASLIIALGLGTKGSLTSSSSSSKAKGGRKGSKRSTSSSLDADSEVAASPAMASSGDLDDSSLADPLKNLR